MTTLFFLGRNPNNLSGVSWKIWRVHRTGKVVKAEWGPADLQARQVRFAGASQAKEWKFRSESAAEADLTRRVREKLREGYERKPRRKLPR
jgi:hypothetical protein